MSDKTLIIKPMWFTHFKEANMVLSLMLCIWRILNNHNELQKLHKIEPHPISTKSNGHCECYDGFTSLKERPNARDFHKKTRLDICFSKYPAQVDKPYQASSIYKEFVLTYKSHF